MICKLLLLAVVLVSLSLEAQASLRGHLQESFGVVRNAASSVEERIVQRGQQLRQSQEHKAGNDVAKETTRNQHLPEFLTEEQDAVCYDCCCDRDVVCGKSSQDAKPQAMCWFKCRAAERDDDQQLCASRNYVCPQYDCDTAADLW